MANPAPTTPADSDYAKGLAITAAGGLLITFDTPLLRLAGADPFTVMFWRGVLAFATILAYWSVRRLARTSPPPLVNGWPGILVAIGYGVSNIFFISALHNTSVANLVFILALTPLVAAMLSVLFLAERIGAATWASVFGGLAGVAVIVYDSLGRGSLAGDLLALAATVSLAATFVVTRASGRDLSMSPAWGGLLAAAFALPLVPSLVLSDSQWFYMLVNGILVVPLAGVLLALGPRYISAPEVAMFLLLETLLAPLWVWLAVGEQPSPGSLAGGTVIVATLVLHSAYRLARTSRPVARLPAHRRPPPHP